jgi:hypothetical protein
VLTSILTQGGGCLVIIISPHSSISSKASKQSRIQTIDAAEEERVHHTITTLFLGRGATAGVDPGATRGMGKEAVPEGGVQRGRKMRISMATDSCSFDGAISSTQPWAAMGS